MWLGVNLTVHRWSLMCTNHTDMTAHSPAFLPSWVPFIYMWSAAQLGIVTYHTLWSNASRTVTHPCTNLAHYCLTSVIKHKMFSVYFKQLVSYPHGLKVFCIEHLICKTPWLTNMISA